MFWLIVLFIIMLWFIGLVVNIGGGMIHLLLLVAAIILIFSILNNRRGVA